MLGRKFSSPNLISSIFLVFLAKTMFFVTRFLKIGHGSTWPGEVILLIKQDFIGRIIKKNKQLKIILVVGTNGKTTSTKLVSHLLGRNGIKVFSNRTGANLLNGIASTLIENANIFGRIKSDVAVFEVDENMLPILLSQFEPTAILALNLFRDQLDRFGEVDIIRAKWEHCFSIINKKTALVLNGQDPNLFFLGKIIENDVEYFGLKDAAITRNKVLSIEADASYCPICLEPLSFSKIAYSHIGIFKCDNCGDNKNVCIDLTSQIESPLHGIFNKYNLSAVALLLKSVFNISPEQISRTIKSFSPAFGRQEIIPYKGRKMFIQLSKNPVGFNQAINLVEEVDRENIKVLILLNDAIPDGLDVSWIWDVYFERLVKKIDKIWVSGGRAFDMAIRIKYAFREVRKDQIDERTIKNLIFVSKDTDNVLKSIIKSSKIGEVIFVFPVYSEMLELRKKLIGDSMVGAND